MLMLLMMCSLSGCVAPEDASTTETDSDAEPPTSEAYTLTTECVTMDGLERCWLLLIPGNLSVENPVPLVLDLHGHGGTSEGQLNLSSFADLAVSEGFIVESPVTIEVFNMNDIDTVAPVGQIVKVYWPDWTNCGPINDSPANPDKTCTFTPTEEGMMSITAQGVDDDGDTTNITADIMVLNIPPTISPPSLITGGEEVMPDENGVSKADLSAETCDQVQAQTRCYTDPHHN